MAWILICPECENRFEADSDTDLKQNISCPSCRKISPPDEFNVLMFCPECRTKLAIPLDMIQENELHCPKCRSDFSVNTGLSLDTDLSTESTFFADAEQLVKSKRILEDGAFFDKFKIIRLLGRGGMGEVYLAEHLLLKRYNALKIMKNTGSDPLFIKRFIREGKLANRIQHPGLISVFDIGHDAKTDCFFIAMEYVDGVDMGHVLKERHLSEKEILDTVLKVLEPLKVLEANKIVHRDIKPSNIMINSDGQVKLADFGIAKVDNREYGEFTLTQENSVFGTPEYASPEQCRSSHDVDTRSDIYSLGATMYHLAARKPPFAGDTVMAVMLNVIQHDPVPLRSIDKSISGGFAELVHDMMQKAPALRPQSIAELEERIRKVYGHAGKIRRLKKSAGEFGRRSKKVFRRIIALIILGALGYGGFSLVTSEKFRPVLKAVLTEARKEKHEEAVPEIKSVPADVKQPSVIANGGTAPEPAVPEKAESISEPVTQNTIVGTPAQQTENFMPVVQGLSVDGLDVDTSGKDQAAFSKAAAVKKSAGKTPDMDIKATGDALCALLAAGASPDSADPEGATALHYGARRNNTEDIRNLLAAGADVNRTDKMGQTPLVWAVKYGSAAAERLLREASANGDIPDFSGSTAENYRAQGEFVRAVLNEDIKTLRSMNRSMVNPDMELPDGKTPLQRACYTLNISLAHTLLDCGADVNFAGNGFAPLQMCFISFRPTLANETREDSQFINSHCNDGGLDCNLAIFKLLLSRGADPNVAPVGHKAKSILYCLAEGDFNNDAQIRFVPEYVKVLEKYGDWNRYDGKWILEKIRSDSSLLGSQPVPSKESAKPKNIDF